MLARACLQVRKWLVDTAVGAASQPTTHAHVDVRGKGAHDTFPSSTSVNKRPRTQGHGLSVGPSTLPASHNAGHPRTEEVYTPPTGPPPVGRTRQVVRKRGFSRLSTLICLHNPRSGIEGSFCSFTQVQEVEEGRLLQGSSLLFCLR